MYVYSVGGVYTLENVCGDNFNTDNLDYLGIKQNQYVTDTFLRVNTKIMLLH